MVEADLMLPVLLILNLPRILDAAKFAEACCVFKQTSKCMAPGAMNCITTHVQTNRSRWLEQEPLRLVAHVCGLDFLMLWGNLGSISSSMRALSPGSVKP